MDNKPQIPQAKEPVEINPIQFQIPECCREGWANCPHVVKKVRPAKRNIGV